MIKKLILHNFMSHVHSEIELSEGLTVLNGPNNCGKSAIVAALDVLSNNLSGDFMVRHGANECYVSVELDGENVVTWRRKGKVTNYEINGREVHRLGKGGVPDDLHQILRMPQIQHPGRQSEPFEIHLAHQKAPIFLLDQPGSRAAMFFASSSDAEKLLRMQQRHRQKVRDARQTLNQKRAVVEALATKRDILQSIGGIDALANRSLTEERALADIAQNRQLAKQLLTSLGRAETRREHIASEVKSLQPLASPPKLHNTGALQAQITQTAQALDRLEKSASLERAFAPLAPPPPLANTQSLSVLVTGLADTSRRAQALQSKATTLLGLRTPPQLADSAVLKRVVEQIEAAEKRVKADRGLVQSLAALTEPPSWQAGESLPQSISKLQRAEAWAKQAQGHAQIMAGLREPPALSEQAAVARTIQKMEAAFDEVSRLREALDHIEQLALLATDSMSLVDPPADAPAMASKRYSGILRYAAITSAILLLSGAGIWVAYTLRMPPDLPLSDVPNGQPPRDSLNDRPAVAFMPPGNVTAGASSVSSEISAHSETDASQKGGLETAAIRPVAGVSGPHAPETTLTSLDPEAPPEAKILALESERNILHDTVQNLETAIEASQAQLIDARKRLATIERDLEALRASMQLDRGSQP